MLVFSEGVVDSVSSKDGSKDFTWWMLKWEICEGEWLESRF